MDARNPELVQALRDAPVFFPEVFPTEGAVRHAIATRDQNGCAEYKVFLKMRGKWHVRRTGLQNWLEAQIAAA